MAATIADRSLRHRIDVLVEASGWNRRLPDAAVRLRRAARAALRSAGPARTAEIAIVLTDDSRQRRLNRTWRGKDRTTNVLAFPAGDDVPAGVALPLGDVVLALGTVAREAAGQEKSLANHASHLVIHGVLHLLGYDHKRAAAAARMERLERRLLADLGIADPYRLPRRAAAAAMRRPARAVAR